MPGLLIGIVWLRIFALICLPVVLIVEWVAGMFAVPGNILRVIRAIVPLIFLAYVLAVLLGAAEPPPPLLWRR